MSTPAKPEAPPPAYTSASPELPDSPAVMAAVLLLVGALYENREALIDRPMADNQLFTRLLNPYRKWAA